MQVNITKHHLTHLLYLEVFGINIKFNKAFPIGTAYIDSNSTTFDLFDSMENIALRLDESLQAILISLDSYKKNMGFTPLNIRKVLEGQVLTFTAPDNSDKQIKIRLACIEPLTSIDEVF